VSIKNLAARWIGNTAYQFHQRGQYEEAERQYRRALEKGDDMAFHYVGFGILLLQKGAFEEAIDLLTRGLELPVDAPTKATLRCHRAVGYLLSGQEAKAMAALEDLHETYPCAQVYQALGYAYIKTGQLDKAVEYCKEAVDYDDKDPVVLDNLAQAYILQGKMGEAWEILQKAHAVKPRQSDILYHMALCAKDRGDAQEALGYVN